MSRAFNDWYENASEEELEAFHERCDAADYAASEAEDFFRKLEGEKKMENGNNDIIAKATGGIDPIPAGLYVGVCVWVVDLGTQHNEKWDNDLHKISITWEIPELLIDTDKGPMPRVISQRYTLSLNERANLRKMLESWRGKPFSADEQRGFNVTKLVGAGCQIQVQQAEHNGKTYANVSAIVPLPKGTKAPKPKTPVVVFSLANCTTDTKIPEALPEWIHGVIMESAEWQATHGTTVEPPEDLTGDDTGEEDIPF